MADAAFGGVRHRAAQAPDAIYLDTPEEGRRWTYAETLATAEKVGRSLLAHGEPGERRVAEGEPLLFDFGTSVDGYASDITRTVSMGAPSARLAEVYAVVQAANAAGRAAAGPGISAQEVDRTTRKVIEDAGFGAYFTHRTGHGLGLEAHEGPNIVEGNTRALEPGMVFTIEPGIYIPGEVGVRIEDNLVITGEGAESLTTFPRELLQVGG